MDTHYGQNMTTTKARRSIRSITGDLVRRGWVRDDSPADEVGECVIPSGCSKLARWSHVHVQGEYCAQHAHQAWQ